MASIRAAGGEAMPVAANLALPEECRRVVEETHAAYGPIDVLVNNAALAYFQPIATLPMNRWMRTWDVNVHAAFVLSQLALEDMVPRRSGSIVTISSAAAVGPGRGPYAAAPEFRNSTAYGAQKAALERFTQGLAQEVFRHGVSVTCVAPSQVVPTPGTVYHGLVTGRDDPTGEPPELMAKAVLLLGHGIAGDGDGQGSLQPATSARIRLDRGGPRDGRGPVPAGDRVQQRLVGEGYVE